VFGHFIDDGYTTTGKIEPAPGIHPALTFTYRPALDRERLAFQRSLQETTDPAKRSRRRAELVVAHVTEWGATDRAGRAIDRPTVELAERLQPLLLDRLVDVVCGYTSNGEEEGDRKN
jgi:hypothetical protein